MDTAAFQAVIDIFNVHASDLTLAQFILALLKDSSLKTHPCTLVLIKDTDNIITALSRHDSTASGSTFTFSSCLKNETCLDATWQTEYIFIA